MKKELIVRSLKEASACIRQFEAESMTLKEKVAESGKASDQLKKEAEALKIAMELVLDEGTMQEVMDKFATIRGKDLSVVREAMDLDLTKKASAMGDLYEADSRSKTMDPVQAFYAILAGNK